MPSNFKPKDPGNPYADYTVANLFEFLSSYRLTRDIGAQFEYSNMGAALLGQALARRAGMDYEALVRALVTHQEVTLDPQIFDRYTGVYQLAPGITLTAPKRSRRMECAHRLFSAPARWRTYPT
ncbi:MAG: serine hydrolase [Candidatus Solibacter sp.]|jgi:CubicO group peptidase (beta-lactamase class C family)